MTLRDSKFTPIAFWLAFLVLGFITSFASPSHSLRKGEVMTQREANALVIHSKQD